MALPISHSLPSLTHGFVPKTLALKRTPSFIVSRRSDYYEPQKVTSRPPPPEDSLSAASKPSRVYVGYSIYKGKAALTIEPRPPEFSPLDVVSLLFISFFPLLLLLVSSDFDIWFWILLVVWSI